MYLDLTADVMSKIGLEKAFILNNQSTNKEESRQKVLLPPNKK